MEIRKTDTLQQNVTYTTPVANPQSATFGESVFTGTLFDYGTYDFSQFVPEQKKKTDSEETAYDAYSEVKQKEGRIPYLCELSIVDAAKKSGVDINRIIQQCIIDADRTQEAVAAGVEISELDIQYNKEVSVLIAQYENKKLAGDEFLKRLESLKIKYLKKDTRDIVPKTATEVTDKQAQQIETAVAKSSTMTVVDVKTARKHSPDQEQKQKLEQAYTESIPEAREKVTKAVIEELPEKLDEDSIKKVVKSTEPVDTIERKFASEIVKEADYLSKEEKDEKLKVIGRTDEEIHKIAKQNTERLTAQIIEERKEAEFQNFTENHKIKSERQESFKNEYKIKNTQQSKLENKENHLKQIMNKLLEIINNNKSNSNADKKSKQKAEYAKYMKNKINLRLAYIQSKKRLLESEIQANERYTTLSILSMEDDFIRNSFNFSL